MEHSSLLNSSHMGGGPLTLELPHSHGFSSEGCAEDDLAGCGRHIVSGCVLGGGPLIGGPRQGLEEVVEQTGAQSFVHPVTGEEHVVHLVHALDVPCAVFLLGLQG